MDIYEEITNQIIEAMEAGKTEGSQLWEQSTSNRIPANFQTNKFYSGINVLLLWSAAKKANFTTNYWLTYKQAVEIGGQVRKGEKSVKCIYYKTLEKSETNKQTGEIEKTNIPMLKAFSVFNIDQIDGLEMPQIMTPNPFEAIECADRILERSQATIKLGGNQAFYRRSEDAIYLPLREQFTKPENFYHVALHELTNWTGAVSRLDRTKGQKFGDPDYAFEELVAELGSAFVNAEIGIIGSTLENHANYIDSWLQVLKNDKRAIFKAAALATKAHQYIMALAEVETARLAA